MRNCKYSLDIMKQELDNKWISPEIKYVFQTSIEVLEKQMSGETTNNSRVEKDSTLYNAINNAIFELFETNIPMNCPSETTKMFIDFINGELGLNS